MNFKYFDFPLYLDNSDKIQPLLMNPKATFHVFLDSEEWNDANKDLLFKILAAIKLNIDEEVQIFGLPTPNRQDIPNTNIHLAQDLDMTLNHRFLGFGMNAHRLGLQISTFPYEILTIRNLKILFSHKLSDLQHNVDYKKKLWSLLQKFTD